MRNSTCSSGNCTSLPIIRAGRIPSSRSFTKRSSFGFLPEEFSLHRRPFHDSHAEVSGVISFYNYFTTTPKGKYRINVCLGTACYVNGSEKVLQEFERVLGIEAGQVTADGKFSIESLRCVGACGLAPVITINDKVYGKVQPGKAHDILEHYLVEVVGEEVPVYA